MSNQASDDRLIKNEKLIRDKNTAASKGIKQYLQNDADARLAPIAFVCECSNLDCSEHINTSIDRYEKLHRRNDRFAVYPGHVIAGIERVVGHQDGFDVVEKYAVKA